MTGFAVFVIVITLSAITLFFPVACVLLSVRKKRKAVRPVEYYAPRGYSPIDVMLSYYGKKSSPRELFNPLMLYWAQKGYITIEEDCKRGLKLTKLKNMPTTSDSPTHSIQLNLFNSMFGSSDVFYTLTATYADGANLNSFMNKVKKCADKGNAELSKKLSIASVIIAAICLITSTGIFIAYIGGVAVVAVFSTIGIFALWSFLKYGNLNSAEKKRINILITLFFCCWGGIPFVLMVYAGIDAGIDIAISVVSIFASAVANIYLISKKIDIRSDKNLEVYGRIDSFKTFLVQAELDKLETLVEDDPDYFYDILPYCYILKITEKLKPKFDKIALDGPSWYLGDLRETLIF